MALTSSNDSSNTGNDRLLPKTSGSRALAHLVTALVSAVIVVVVGSKIVNGLYFSGPLVTFVCDDGSYEQSDKPMTEDEKDRACGDPVRPPATLRTTTTRPPYTETEFVSGGKYLKYRWDEMSTRLEQEGFANVDALWPEQFEDLELGQIVYGLCDDAEGVELGENSLQELVALVIASDARITVDDQTSSTGLVLITMEKVCGAQGSRLGLRD